MIEFTSLQLAFMEPQEREDIERAKARGFVFSTYHCSTKDYKGNDYEYEALFSPAQFRAITAVPFPECATMKNCRHLLHIWNKASTDHPRIYTLRTAPQQ